jgi:hypothetical protein
VDRMQVTHYLYRDRSITPMQPLPHDDLRATVKDPVVAISMIRVVSCALQASTKVHAIVQVHTTLLCMGKATTVEESSIDEIAI